MLFDGLANILNSVRNLITGIFVTKAQETQNEMDAANTQAEITKAEISNSNSWIAGGRACLIWICDICVAIVWIPQYFLGSYFFVRDCLKAHHLVSYPLDDVKLIEFLICLLGLVGIRFITKK